jgi:hypothetical protein
MGSQLPLEEHSLERSSLRTGSKQTISLVRAAILLSRATDRQDYV